MKKIHFVQLQSKCYPTYLSRQSTTYIP